MNRVAIARCENYEEDSVASALKDVLDASAFPDCRGKTILVKPNILSDSRPEAGITTHPSVVEALIRECFRRGAAKVYAGDSPGLHTPVFKGRNCGIAGVCERTGAIWVDFTQDTRTYRLEGGIKVQLPAILDEVDFTISAAKFKTHQLMYTTGAVKNMFGLMPGLTKSPTHLRYPSRSAFASFINRLFKVSKVEYAILDAVIGMEGPGPANGTLRYVGYLIGGRNAYLVDTAEAVIMGYAPKDIPILQSAGTTLKPQYSILHAEDLVIKDFRKIEVEKPKGLFSSLVLPFLTRSHDRKETKKRPAPQFEADKCIHCLRCVQICPAKALVHDGDIRIDTAVCIRCYCCAEMCPADAIKVGEH